MGSGGSPASMMPSSSAPITTTHFKPTPAISRASATVEGPTPPPSATAPESQPPTAIAPPPSATAMAQSAPLARNASAATATAAVCQMMARRARRRPSAANVNTSGFQGRRGFWKVCPGYRRNGPVKPPNYSSGADGVTTATSPPALRRCAGNFRADILSDLMCPVWCTSSSVQHQIATEPRPTLGLFLFRRPGLPPMALHLAPTAA